MATKFQIDYLVGLVSEELKRQKTALIEEHREEINLTIREYVDEHQLQKLLWEPIRQFFANAKERVRLENENDEILAQMHVVADSLWKTASHGLPTKWSGEHKEDTVSEATEAEIKEFCNAIEKQLLPDITKRLGIAEKLAELDERGKDLTTKVTLSLNMSALRKAIVEVNAFLGLNLQV